jgi:hypothetical protein
MRAGSRFFPKGCCDDQAEARGISPEVTQSPGDHLQRSIRAKYVLNAAENALLELVFGGKRALHGGR